jgi:hypothetical protein
VVPPRSAPSCFLLLSSSLLLSAFSVVTTLPTTTSSRGPGRHEVCQPRVVLEELGGGDARREVEVVVPGIDRPEDGEGQYRLARGGFALDEERV